MLELRRVRKHYPDPGGAVRAVEDVDVTIGAGELVVLLGPSGSGKTTLLLLAAGLLRPDAGSVSFRGRELARLSKPELLSYRRTRLGFVSQSHNLLAGLTAEENVAVPLLLRGDGHARSRERALAALAEVGLAGRHGRCPEQLSGGERQRVAIARALVGEPSLVLADEPTGSLDSATGENALALLRSLTRARGAAVMLVTHDPSAARFADRVLQMRDGRTRECEHDREIGALVGG